ncbi:hypothetical protein ANCCAN_11888 [Ancylostoma caninum]|uniref:Uncharacterized protein n=1 Tax=Ancylostoma caninum TaxID=29170 RepID=A0A368GCM6_ANCCA|nr:hypothetical protein ANCCAN_11888 [Ancylostoma caninum]
MDCGEISVPEVHKVQEVHDNPKDEERDDINRRRRRLQQELERIVSVLENGRRVPKRKIDSTLLTTLIRVRISAGINPHVRDSKGRTALEVLRENEQHRISDLTHIIQSREGWSECRQIIEDYIQRLESDHFNSSSDSGIDRRDSERSVVDDDTNCDIWRPLPPSRNADSSLAPPVDALNSMSPDKRLHGLEVMVSVDAVHAGIAKRKPCENAEPLSDAASHWIPSYSAFIHRTWNSKMYGKCRKRNRPISHYVANEQSPASEIKENKRHFAVGLKLCANWRSPRTR